MHRSGSKLKWMMAAMMSIAANAFAADAIGAEQPATTQRAATQSVSGRPTSHAATSQPAETIQKWLNDLADAEPGVRESARDGLLRLSRADLPTLREAIRASQPLAPSQSNVLHGIVTHVYLASEEYPSEPGVGFLGVRLAEVNQNQIIPPQTVEFDADGKAQAGVLIRQCMPGFAAYAALREGDVVLSIGDDGEILTPTQETLVAAVSMRTPGQLLKLHLLRQGRPMDVTLRLSPRPKAAGAQMTTEQMINERIERSEDYWKANFATLVTGPMS